MIKKGIRQVDIARELGITRQTVCKVVGGREKSSRVVEWLKKHGCPESFLGLNR
jgi:predicted transcriptional regulator